MDDLTQHQKQEINAAGPPPEALEDLSRALKGLSLPPRATGEDLEAHSSRARQIYQAGAKLLSCWPPKPKRNPAQARAADLIKGTLRNTRNLFAHAYVEFIFGRITRNFSRLIRAEALVFETADLCPGLCPNGKEVEVDSHLPLAEKEGVEIAQTDFLAHLFANRAAGLYLIHSMLQPLPQSRELLEKFQREEKLDLGTALVESRVPVGCVFYNNLRYLNAEDDTTVIPLEMATDLVLMDPRIEVGVLRGSRVDYPKYRGRRILSAGLNLTRLYHGKIPMMFYVTRELGFVNKLYRGLAGESFDPEAPEETLEKPWIAALETFAIGGGCQVLLVMDYVIAEDGSYFTLPARKEGIIPGVAPLRFSRFVGERMAQQGILFDKAFPVSSLEAGALVNDVVPAAQMDEALERAAIKVTSGGLVSAEGNRKAIRLGHEPVDLFRQYMALYCREQSNCHFSPALISNLERNWDAANRRLAYD